ncbi:MAG: hypothetical protein IIX44_10870 [Clostridia bacterium]|nr:hypothetical protein [Clostridia bacterium]
MFLFQKKEEKTNYWKIVGITLGIIAAIGAAGVALYALLKRAGYFCCCDDYCDCCDCDDCCLDDELCDEIELEDAEEEELAADAE